MFFISHKHHSSDTSLYKKMMINKIINLIERDFDYQFFLS